MSLLTSNSKWASLLPMCPYTSSRKKLKMDCGEGVTLRRGRQAVYHCITNKHTSNSDNICYMSKPLTVFSDFINASGFHSILVLLDKEMVTQSG